MKINYSCVVDKGERYKKQCWIWLNSLIKFGKINPSDIWIHCVNGVEKEHIDKYLSAGVNVVMTEPYGDKTYCNKIAQMSDDRLKESDAIILMDTDMIMLDNFEDTLDYNYISAKIVNSPNPEIDVIDELFALAELKKSIPDVCVELSADDITYGANFNGGIYVIPQKYYNVIQSGWEKWSQWLLGNGKPLYEVKKEAHIDQISFCMTIHENNIPVKYLTRLYNHPMPFYFDDLGRIPYVLHYHTLMDGSDFLTVDYEPAENIKRAIDAANEFIRQIVI